MSRVSALVSLQGLLGDWLRNKKIKDRHLREPIILKENSPKARIVKSK
jgi:hypothetical protein